MPGIRQERDDRRAERRNRTPREGQPSPGNLKQTAGEGRVRKKKDKAGHSIGPRILKKESGIEEKKGGVTKKSSWS